MEASLSSHGFQPARKQSQNIGVELEYAFWKPGLLISHLWYMLTIGYRFNRTTSSETN